MKHQEVTERAGPYCDKRVHEGVAGGCSPLPLEKRRGRGVSEGEEDKDERNIYHLYNHRVGKKTADGDEREGEERRGRGRE